MTAPVNQFSPAFSTAFDPPPVTDWLDPDDVTRWLTSSGVAVLPEPQDLDRVCGSVALFCQAARPEMMVTDDATGTATYVPDDEVMQAAVMLAAKVVRRRNSPGGIEQFGTDGLVSYVARSDPEIDRALRLAGWIRPAVG